MHNDRHEATAFDETGGHYGELFRFRPLTAGYAESIDYPRFRDNYPWQGFWNPPHVQNFELLSFGPEMRFAEKLHQDTGDTILIIKMAVGGSQIFDLQSRDWNANLELPSHLDVLLNYYWDLGKAAAFAQFAPTGGPAVDVYLGGVISFIGTSDSRGAYFQEYESNLTDVISTVRTHIHGGGGQGMDDIPWLILGSPTPDSVNPQDFLDLRQAQENVAQSGNNIGYLNADPIFAFGSGQSHADAQGNYDLGEAIALWAAAQTPYQL